jgi:hypothetical protein
MGELLLKMGELLDASVVGGDWDETLECKVSAWVPLLMMNIP